jgi:hypothetical protein
MSEHFSMPGRNTMSEHFVHVRWEQYIGIVDMSAHFSMSGRNNMSEHFAGRVGTLWRNTFQVGQEQYVGIVYMLEHFSCQAGGICQNS